MLLQFTNGQGDKQRPVWVNADAVLWVNHHSEGKTTIVYGDHEDSWGVVLGEADDVAQFIQAHMSNRGPTDLVAVYQSPNAEWPPPGPDLEGTEFAPNDP